MPSSNLGGVAFHWNGKRWTLLSMPTSTRGASFVSLQSVSCPDGLHCVVVGVDTFSSGERLLAYELVGSTWRRIQPESDPAWNLEGQGGLVSVSCTSPRSCVAVGPITIHRLQATLVESWHGGSWVPDVGSVRQRPPMLRRGVGS